MPEFIVVDLEATDRDAAKAHIVEWAAVAMGAPFQHSQPTTMYGGLVRPPVPIPPETSAVHHIIDEDVADAYPWEKESQFLMSIFEERPDSIAVAHNAAYERTALASLNIPCRGWICTYKAALRVWPDAPGHSNETLRYWLKLGGGRRAHNKPHTALHDAIVTSHILKALLDAGASIDDMLKWADEPALLPTCPLGDWRGHPWPEVEESFLHWILRRITDREDVRFCAQKELERREEERRAHTLGPKHQKWHLVDKADHQAKRRHDEMMALVAKLESGDGAL